MDISPEAVAALEEMWKTPIHPTLIVCAAKSEQGQFILNNRDGETDFDGFHHAYVKRGDQTFLVPLWEWKEPSD